MASEAILFGENNTPIKLQMSTDMKEDETTIYGASGLINSGNTCYMNSAIQVLAHLPLLANYLLRNETIIRETLLKNFPRVYKSSDKFNPAKEYKGIPNELKEFVNSDNYDYKKLSTEYETILLNSTMTYQLYRLIEQMWKENCTISPVAFRTIFSEARNRFFFGHDQHDAEEAYSCIMQQLQDELATERPIQFKTSNQKVVTYNLARSKLISSLTDKADTVEKTVILEKLTELRKQNPTEALTCDAYREMQKVYGKTYSEIFAYVTGILYSSTNCPDKNCMYHSNKFDAFSHLSIPITSKKSVNNVNIYDCLDEFTADETLDKDNLWSCDGCKQKVQAVKKLKLWINPPVLVLHLKRFNHNGGKNNTFIEYPLKDLDMAKYISEEKINDKVETKYTLQSVILHSGGGLNSGHYFSYSKFIPSNEWLEYNDDTIRNITEEQVVSQRAYLLIYMRNDVYTTQLDNQMSKLSIN